MNSRFPLPVSHSRAPFTLRRSTAWMLALALFGAGFVAAVYTVGFIVTAS